MDRLILSWTAGCLLAAYGAVAVVETVAASLAVPAESWLEHHRCWGPFPDQEPRDIRDVVRVLEQKERGALSGASRRS